MSSLLYHDQTKGVPNKRHTGEFKQQAVEYMREHKLSCVETAKIFDTDHKNKARWSEFAWPTEQKACILSAEDVVEQVSRQNHPSR